jgi:hypothetical protein
MGGVRGALKIVARSARKNRHIPASITSGGESELGESYLMNSE